MNYEVVVKNIRENLERYIIDNNIKSLVIGISGGIDSAVCAALARPVCDKLGIPLIGKSLPSSSNKKDEQDRADVVGGAFCSYFDTFDIQNMCGIISGQLLGKKCMDRYANIDAKFRRGNIMARIRMIILYDTSQENNGMVLSTDNYTEYLLGFWTLHGDVGDYGMVQNLWKTEVYELAKYICDRELVCNCDCHNPDKMVIHFRACCNTKESQALRKCIDAVPTDGLGITDSDMEQIGCKDYREVDMLLLAYTTLCKIVEYDPASERELLELMKHPVIKRHLATRFKRNNPYNISREDICG